MAIKMSDLRIEMCISAETDVIFITIMDDESGRGAEL